MEAGNRWLNMSGETRYVGWSASDSTYVCDGANDDIQINQALAWAAANPGNTVHLRGPYTYDIRATLRIGSSTVFTGDSTAIIRLNDSCAWSAMVPVIGQYGGAGTVSTGIEIYGFQIDCNEANLYGVGGRIHGKGYYNAIYVQGQSTSRASDIHVHNMKIYNSLGDGVRISYGTNIRIHDCDLWNLEHCAVFCIDSTEINVYDNEIQAITCSGVRLDNCQDWSVNNNNIIDWTGTSNAPKLGAHGVQFGNEPSSYNHTTLTKNGKIYDNTIDVGACGLQIEDYLKTAGSTAQNVEIRNNIISGGSTNWATYFSGISIYSWGNGLTISKNTITGSARAGILVSGAITTGVSVTVSENNIINTVKAGTDGGYGFWNKVPTKFTVIASGNYSTNNISGNYKNVTPSSESSNYIDDAIPGGAPDVDDPDTPNTPDHPDYSIYVPATSSIIDDDTDYYFTRVPTASYINGVRFRYISYSTSGGKTIGQSKSPSVAGYNLSDFDFEGSTTTFECVALSNESKNEVLAAFYQTGRSKIDLGGAHDGYRIIGTGVSHNNKIDLRTDNPYFNINGAQFYNLTFLNEHPYMETIYPRVRGRYIYNSMQFSSDDIYAGNLVQNSSFEEWTPNTSLIWNLQTSASDNTWEDIEYAKEITQFCSVASAGTSNTLIQISSDAKTWTVPTGLTSAANCNNAWKCVSRCGDWETWAAFSSSGVSGYGCIKSIDGNTWAAVSTPSGADGIGWSTSVFIPATSDIVILGDSEGNELYIEEDGVQYLLTIDDDRTVLETGRILVLASSGTGNRVMYSDDEMASWTIVASADDTASWIDSAYSPELRIVVAVAYSGEISYSSDFGATWSLATDTGQKLTSVTWSSFWGMFVCCSEDGTQQILTSEDAINWVYRDTPYTSTETYTPGEVVKTLSGSTKTGWNYTTKATSYTGSDGYPSLQYTFVLPALLNGHNYRLENVRCKLRSVYAGATASMKVTVQAPSLYSGVETTIKEWTETKTTYQSKSYDLSLDSSTAEAVTIRFYLKTSKASIRAGATLMGYTVSEMTASGSTIVYHRNQWRGIVSANEIGLVAAVANTGTGNRVMYATSPEVWNTGVSPADYSWEMPGYAAELNIFAAIGKSGAGTRVMTLERYGSLIDVPPVNWTLETPGITRSDDYVVDGNYSLQITGNGLENPGQITQVLPFDTYYDSAEMFILSGQGKVSNLTSGCFKCDIYAGGSVVKELVWDANTDDWEEKQIRLKFDTVPNKVYARVHGSGTPNVGAVFNFEDIIVERLSDYENGQKGLEIITNGKYPATPDVTIRGISVSDSSASTSRKISDVTGPEEVFERTSNSYGYPVWTVTLPASENSAYKIDELSFYIKSSNALAYSDAKVTIQAASLYNGKETSIMRWTTNQTSNYKHCVYNVWYSLQSAVNESVTLRYYLRSTKTSYKVYAYKLAYKCTEVIDVDTVSASDVSIYNTADSRRILHLCNSLPQGYMARIRGDYTGSYRYIEHFKDGAYASNAYSMSGSIARNDDNNSLTMASGSSIVFPFSTLYPVTGIPFVKMYVYSGIPQISIADNSGTDGAPGTFYPVDTNTSASLNGAEIQRELDNINNLRLKGKTKYYMKIEPYSGQSCEFSQMLEYASLDTMDAMRFFIYPTGLANTLSVIVGGTGKCSAVISLSYRDTEIHS